MLVSDSVFAAVSDSSRRMSRGSRALELSQYQLKSMVRRAAGEIFSDEFFKDQDAAVRIAVDPVRVSGRGLSFSEREVTRHLLQVLDQSTKIIIANQEVSTSLDEESVLMDYFPTSVQTRRQAVYLGADYYMGAKFHVSQVVDARGNPIRLYQLTLQFHELRSNALLVSSQVDFQRKQLLKPQKK